MAALAAGGMLVALIAAARVAVMSRRFSARRQSPLELRFEVARLRARGAKVDGGGAGGTPCGAPTAPTTPIGDLDDGQVPDPDASLARSLDGSSELATLDARIAHQSAQLALARAQRTPAFSTRGGPTHDAPRKVDGGGRADRRHCALLERTQELGLQRERQVADLI